MNVHSEISVALVNMMGDVGDWFAHKIGHDITVDCANGGHVVVEKSLADAVRVSRCVGDEEHFACYVQFAGEENPKTLAWKPDRSATVLRVLSLEGAPATRQQLEALRSALGLPVAEAVH